MKKIREEIEKNNNAIIRKKQLERDALQILLSENEVNKQKAREAIFNEKQDDIKCSAEYGRILDKQDIERNTFFKNKMRIPNEVAGQMIENVLKDMDAKKRLEEEKIYYYGIEKEKK